MANPALSDPSDEDLLRQLQDGERQALAVLYERYAPTMIGLGVKMLKNRSEAEDVVHDVFMQAWSKAHTYDPERGSVRGWLLLRARSRLLDRLRSAPRRREVLVDKDVDAKAEPNMQAPTVVRLNTERVHLQQALAALSRDQLHAIDCVYFQAMTLSEAADVLAVPIGTVKSRLHHARTTLRQALQRQASPQGASHD